MEENRRNMRRRGRFGGRRAASSAPNLASRRRAVNRSRVGSNWQQAAVNRQRAARPGMTRGGFLRTSGLAAAGVGAAAMGMGRVARAAGTPDHSQGVVVQITTEGDESNTSTFLALVYDAEKQLIALAPLIVEDQETGLPVPPFIEYAGPTGTTVKRGVTVNFISLESPHNPLFNLNNQIFNVTHGIVYEGILTFQDGNPQIPPLVISYIIGQIPEPPHTPGNWTLYARNGVGRLHANTSPRGFRHGSFYGTVTLLDENFEPYMEDVKAVIMIIQPSGGTPKLSRVDIFE